MKSRTGRLIRCRIFLGGGKKREDRSKQEAMEAGMTKEDLELQIRETAKAKSKDYRGQWV